MLLSEIEDSEEEKSDVPFDAARSNVSMQNVGDENPTARSNVSMQEMSGFFDFWWKGWSKNIRFNNPKWV